MTRGVLLLQDNALGHTSQVAMTAASECGFEVLPHPPYSPDIAPSDFYLFPKLKSSLRGTQFGSNEGVIAAVNEYFGGPGKGLLFGRDKQARTELRNRDGLGALPIEK